MSKVVISNVKKKYGDFEALKGVSITIQSGGFTSILGPSGCGKTTLLRCIAGLEDIFEGKIYIGDTLVSENNFTISPDKRNIGLVFQSYALWPHMNVYKNVAYALKLMKLGNDEINEKVNKALSLVGMTGYEKRYPNELSGGQMQRIAVARSLAPEPKVLLLDEPLSNLDAKLREKMRFELREIQQRVGITAIYVTHDQSEAMVLSDDIILMNHGVIVQTGTAQHLYEEPINLFAADFLGICNFMKVEISNSKIDEKGHAYFKRNNLKLKGYLPEKLRDRKEVTVAIRPQNIKLESDNSNEENVIDGCVKEIVYLGNTADIYFDIGENISLRSQIFCRECEGITPGAKVKFYIMPSDIIAVEESESAIESEADLERDLEQLSPVGRV